MKKRTSIVTAVGIEAWRRKEGLSLNELAEELELRPEILDMVEKGWADLSPREAETWARRLCVPVSEVFLVEELEDLSCTAWVLPQGFVAQPPPPSPDLQPADMARLERWLNSWLAAAAGPTPSPKP